MTITICLTVAESCRRLPSGRGGGTTMKTTHLSSLAKEALKAMLVQPQVESIRFTDNHVLALIQQDKDNVTLGHHAVAHNQQQIESYCMSR